MNTLYTSFGLFTQIRKGGENVENEKNISNKNVTSNEMNSKGQVFGGRGILGLRIRYQRILIWIIAILFLLYSIYQNQLWAGIIGLVVAYVINRR